MSSLKSENLCNQLLALQHPRLNKKVKSMNLYIDFLGQLNMAIKKYIKSNKPKKMFDRICFEFKAPPQHEFCSDLPKPFKLPSIIL